MNTSPSGRTGRPHALWLGFAFLSITLIAAYPAASPAVEGYIYQTLALLCCASTFVAARRSEGSKRRGWLLIASGLLYWAVANAIWQTVSGGADATTFPAPMDVLYLLAYPVIATGMVLLGRKREGASRAETIDSALIAISLGAVIWTSLASPFIGAGYSGLQLVVALVYPAGDALMLGVLARLLFVGTNRTFSSRVLIGAGALLVVLDGVYLEQSLMGTYEAGSGLDHGWLLCFALVGVASLHPSAASVGGSDKPNDRRLSLGRITLAVALPSIAPALFAAQIIAGVHVNRIVMFASTGILFLLSLARVRGIVSDYNAQLIELDQQKEDLSKALDDISENTKALRFQAQVFEEVDSFVLAFSETGILTYCNGYAERYFGVTKDEVLGRSWTDMFPNLDGEILAVIGGSLDRNGTWEGDVTIDLPTGEEGVARALVSLMHDEDGEVIGTICLGRDARPSRELEEGFRRAQKLEAFGQLAGGVAHDFNNLLSIVINYARFMINDMDIDDPRAADAREIMKAGERGARLTRQLLTFSRKTTASPETLSLNEVVKDIGRMLSRTIPENVSFSIDLEDGLWLTRIDPGHMEQVIMNLVVNARDAMPISGSITMTTQNLVLDKAEATRLGLNPGRYVSLAVADTGHGMDEETRARIFEPFFTTKEVGKGTGLGLATVYGIVDQANGTIDVATTEGVGTTFTVYLPFEIEQPEGWHHTSRPDPVLRGNGERIALAEDEDGVRHLVTRMLRRNGYVVQAYATPEEAAKDFEEGGATADLLLTDMVMPGLSGIELADRVALPTLYMTGHSELEAERARNLRTLSKPFDEAELISAVRSALAS